MSWNGLRVTCRIHGVLCYRWLVGVSYRIITFKDPVPSLERGKRAISQLAPVPGAIYLSRGSMTSDAPSTLPRP